MTTSKQQANSAIVSIYKTAFGVLILLGSVVVSAYTGFASAKQEEDFINKDEYLIDRSEDKEERKELSNKIDKIYEAVRKTAKDVAVIKGVERVRREERARLRPSG